METSSSRAPAGGLVILALALAMLALPAARAGAACPGWVDAATRSLSSADLSACTCQQLEILRNEIYARHGRIFSRPDLQQYFNSQPWYKPDPKNPNGDRGQNNFERQNATRVLNHEKSVGCKEGSTITPPPAGGTCPAWAAASARYLSDQELAACSCQELELLRNEIYARHGRVFTRSDLQSYFQAQSWYRPDAKNATGEKGQNQYESGNAVRILNQEKARGCSTGATASTGASSGACPAWPAPQVRALSDSELAACSCKGLELLRNEIYARHGRIFTRADLQQYFNAQSWYRPDPNNAAGEKGMNKTEQGNADRIKKQEQARGCR